MSITTTLNNCYCVQPHFEFNIFVHLKDLDSTSIPGANTLPPTLINLLFAQHHPCCPTPAVITNFTFLRSPPMSDPSHLHPCPPSVSFNHNRPEILHLCPRPYCARSNKPTSTTPTAAALSASKPWCRVRALLRTLRDILGMLIENWTLWRYGWCYNWKLTVSACTTTLSYLSYISSYLFLNLTM